MIRATSENLQCSMQKIEEFNEIWVRAAVDLNEQRLGGTKVQKVTIFPFSKITIAERLKK